MFNLANTIASGIIGLMATTLGDRFEVLDGLDSVLARCVYRLQFGLSEWFLRPSSGIPYEQDIFSNSRGARALSIIKRQLLSVPDVTGVDIEVLPTLREGRLLRLRVVVQSDFGVGSTDIEI